MGSFKHEQQLDNGTAASSLSPPATSLGMHGGAGWTRTEDKRTHHNLTLFSIVLSQPPHLVYGGGAGWTRTEERRTHYNLTLYSPSHLTWHAWGCRLDKKGTHYNLRLFPIVLSQPPHLTCMGVQAGQEHSVEDKGTHYNPTLFSVISPATPTTVTSLLYLLSALIKPETLDLSQKAKKPKTQVGSH